MPETTPLIKAALNLRGGAGFDVYEMTFFCCEKGQQTIIGLLPCLLVMSALLKK